ncbi:MAG: hypothetical protein Q9M28_06930 [Mariprofundaceae bacterium]|nr:hypothetical protein [Mariprofundaceae bacterium]
MKKEFSKKYYLIMILITFFLFGKSAYADNVAMVETMKYLAPETVNMVIARAKAGGPYGFQVGDTIRYIVKYKPIPNGGNTGVNGYITDYMPNGLQVIGAGFLQPDGFGGYFDVPSAPAGDMSNTPLGNGNRNAVALSPLLPATPINIAVEAAGTGGPLNQGTMAQFYGDVGVWYSTDIRTAYNNGAAGASRNAWDLAQINYENICAQNNGGAEGPWGTGSPVAGPETFYQHEVLALAAPCVAGPIGPWHRIAVPGSRIGTYGLLGDLQANRELFPGDPLYGRDVLANPLPVASALNPITLRWANGLNSVGEIKYVTVTARIASLPPGGTIINNSEVWGGDVFYAEGGKDNPWKYNNTLVAVANNSDMVVLKTPSTESAAIGDVVSFQITIINTGAKTHHNVQVVDYLNTSHKPGIGNPFEIMIAYNNDASVGGFYCLGAAGHLAPLPADTTLCSLGGSERVVWNLPILTPGSSQTFAYSVTALTPLDPKVTSATDIVVATSDQLPLPGASAGAGFEIGTFPILNQTKTVTPSIALPGGIVRYHIQITNSGSGYAGGYVDSLNPLIRHAPYDALQMPISTLIHDTLPSGFAYAGNVNANIDGIAFTPVVSAIGNTITWAVPHVAFPLPLVQPFPLPINLIAPGSTLNLWFDAMIHTGIAPGTYTNSVSTTVPYNGNAKPGKLPEPQKSALKGKIKNKTDWVSMPVYNFNTAPVTVGSVLMNVTATPSTVENTPTGVTTSYTITISNNGAIAASNIIVKDILPVGFSYQVASTTGTAAVGEPNVTGQTITWPAFTLAANSSATIQFNANLSSTVLAAVYYSDVSATASNAIIPALPQSAAVVVTAPGLSISKSVDRSSIIWLGDGYTMPPFPNEVVHYTITATNTGTAASIVDISDQLPHGFEYDPLLGIETITRTVAGVSTPLTRTIDYATFPILLSSTPNWGTFSIPAKVGANNSSLSIRFPVRINMAETPGLANAVSNTGSYNNAVTVAGNVALPVFSGAPITIYRPARKSTNTPQVAVNGMMDYRFRINNLDTYAWSAVSVVDYLGKLTTAGILPAVPSGVTYGLGNDAYTFIGTTEPTGQPGVDPQWIPTTPIYAPPMLTFNNGGIGFSIPAGQSLFVALTATAPAAVPIPAKVDNSIQSLAYTINGIAKIIHAPYDGGLASHVTEDISLTAIPTLSLSSIKTVSPSSLYLYGATALNALTYQITMVNNDPAIAATGGLTIIDTLPLGITANPINTETTFVDLYTAAGLFLSTTNVSATNVWNALSNQLTMMVPAAISIPPLGGYINIRFTASVTALTAANTYYNSASWTGINVNAGSLGPTAPLSIDPVLITTQALTPSAVAGGTANYRITLKNTGNKILTTLSLTDYLGGLTPALVPSGFLFGADLAVSLNGTALNAGVDYIAPIALRPNPTWTFLTTIPAGAPSAASTLTIDFYANIPALTIIGTYHNSISNLSFTPTGLAPVIGINPFDGANVSHTVDNVAVATVGISKIVINPYSSVNNDPLLGTITQYQLTVTNTSAATQTVSVQDSLPTGFSIAAGSAYVATGMLPPLAPPPSLGWTLTTANTALPQSLNIPLFNNAGAGFAVLANQNLYLAFTANIVGTVTPGMYNNRADVRLTAAPTVIVGSTIGAPVTVSSPQAFISKITTTPHIGKDIYGNYSAAHYRITMINTGNVDATGIVIADTLPLNFALSAQPTVSINGVRQAPASFLASQVGQLLSINNLPATGFSIPARTITGNGSLIIEYDAAIANTVLAGLHNNTAHATSLNAGRLPSNVLNDPYASVTLHDLGLSKIASATTAAAGSNITYTITVTNFGATLLSNVVVRDYLPSGFNYQLTSTLINGIAAPDPSLLSGLGLPIWTIASLAANSSATVQFTVNISTSVGAATHYNNVVATHGIGVATIAFPDIGPTAPVSTQLNRPLLAISKQANTSTAASNDIVMYTILIRNTGSGQATNVHVSDALSSYTKLTLDPFGTGSIFQFSDGLNPSGLLGTAIVTYSNDNGVSFLYTPIDDGTGHDPAITHFNIQMNGTMNSNTVSNPSFQVQYSVQVQ